MSSRCSIHGSCELETAEAAFTIMNDPNVHHVALVAEGILRYDAEIPGRIRELFCGEVFNSSVEVALATAGENDTYLLSSHYGLHHISAEFDVTPANHYDNVTFWPYPKRHGWAESITNELVELYGASTPLVIDIFAAPFQIHPLVECLHELDAQWMIRTPLFGLSLGERIRWLAERLKDHGLLPFYMHDQGWSVDDY